MTNPADNDIAHFVLDRYSDLLALSDEEAFWRFKEARWPGGEPVCPECGALDHYWLGTRKQWRCKSCNHTFSITSGTIFHSHKLPLQVCLAAISYYAWAWSPIRTSEKLDVQYRTAWELTRKQRVLFDGASKGARDYEI